MSRPSNSEVGKRFGTHSQIEVLSISGSNCEYICHICKLDKELFGEGKFITRYFHLQTGHYKCGCSKGCRYSKEQAIILIERKCVNRGMQFVEFCGEYEGRKSKIRLKCLKDQILFDVPISSVSTSEHICPECAQRARNESRRVDEAVIIERFMSTGKFHEETVFERKEDRYWKVFCPICSVDKYVVNGLCDGVFYAHESNLTAGKHPCRCAHNVRWTKAQREFQITEALLKQQQYKFVGWVDGKVDIKSKITINCKDHGNWDISINKFLNQSQRCSGCRKTGYSKNKVGSLYILNITSSYDSSSFVGYGISNILDERIKEHSRNLSRNSFKIEDGIALYGSGEAVYEVEKAIKNNFPLNPQIVEGFVTEATHSHLLNQVINFAKEFLYDYKTTPRM